LVLGVVFVFLPGLYFWYLFKLFGLFSFRRREFSGERRVGVDWGEGVFEGRLARFLSVLGFVIEVIWRVGRGNTVIDCFNKFGEKTCIFEDLVSGVAAVLN
jgi:hypothetical protein